MTERKRSSPSLWKKLKSAIKKLTGDDKKGAIDMNMQNPDDILSDEGKEVLSTEEQEWVAAFQERIEQKRKSMIESVCRNIEKKALTSFERIELFKQEAPDELKLWWSNLASHPESWEMLRKWLSEDDNSVQQVQNQRM